MRYILILAVIAGLGIWYAQWGHPPSNFYIDESDDPPVWNPK